MEAPCRDHTQSVKYIVRAPLSDFVQSANRPDLIASDKLRQRTTGINQLREFLQRSQNVASLSPTGRKRTLNLMFDLTAKERTAYVLGKHRNDGNDAGAQRLSNAGEITRVLVATGITEFKGKMCRLVLSHIADTLLAPTLAERVCMPLLDSYSKTFRLIVEHPAHVEHLSLKDIQTYLTFLCKAVDAIIESMGASIDTESSIYLFADSAPSLSNQRRMPYAIAELLQSIQLLLNISSGITLNQLSDIWNTVGRYINSTTESAMSDSYAIGIANVLLNLASSRDLNFCESVSLLMLERLPELWKSKSLPVREGLLIFLQLSFPFMTTIVTKIDEAPQDIQDLIQRSISEIRHNISSEAAFSSLNLNLLSSDIDINNQTPQRIHDWFTQSHFHLKSTGNILAWMTMLSYHNITVLEHIINFSSFASRSKKRKAASNAASPDLTSLEHHVFQEIIFDLEGEGNLTRNIQSLIVHMQQDEMPEFLASRAFIALCEVSNPTHTETSAWALLAICYLLHSFPNFSFETIDLDNLWNILCKGFYHPSLSTVSSFCLSTMLAQNRISASVRKPKIERLLSMFDSSGPHLSNGSVYLARQLLSTYSLSIVDKLQSAVDKLMFWLMALLQVDNNSRKSGSSVSPAVISSLILEFCRIPFESGQMIRYSGVFQLEALRANTNNAGLGYTRTGIVPSIDPCDTIKKENDVPRFVNPSTEIISGILTSLMEACDRLNESLSDNDNEMKFSSYPVLYEPILNFIGAIFMVSLQVEKTNQVFQSQCRELTMILQSIFKKLCSTLKAASLQEDHVRYILHGMEYFVQIYPYISDSFYREVYRQDLDDILAIFQQNRSAPGSFDDEMKGNETLTKVPLPASLHLYVSLQSTEDVQLYMSYTKIRLLQSKIQDDINYLEAISRLIQSAESSNEVAAICATFIDNVSKTSSQSPALALPLQKFIRTIGEKLLSVYEWDRAESTLLLCIKVLHDYASIWTVHEIIHSDFSDIFSWLCKLVFDGGYKNVRVQERLGKLLTEIMTYTPRLVINEDKTLPGYFGMLFADSSDVSYSCADLLPKVFKNYPITSHITFFNGIQDVMGQISNEKENLAARCYVLIRLAQSGDSLVIGSMFNLLEFAVFQEAQMYIKSGIREICKFYKEDSLQKFLARQAEELLYLWFSNEVDIDFPFEYFGYLTEEAFLNEYYPILTLLLLHFKKSQGFPHITKIAHKIASKNIDVLLIPALPIVWAYELTTEPNIQKNFWLTKEVGTDKWKKCTSQGLAVFVSSLMLLVNFSTVPASILGKEDIFSKIYSQTQPATLVSFPQPLVTPSNVIRLIHQAISQSSSPINLSNPSSFSFISRAIINKIVHTVDPIQKCINLRRLLFFASNFSTPELSDYPLEILLTAIVSLINDPIARPEAFMALEVLMQNYTASLLAQPDLLLEISLRCLVFSFQARQDNSERPDLTFLRILCEQAAEPWCQLVRILFAWLNSEDVKCKSFEFTSTFTSSSETSKKLLLSCIAFELDRNVYLQEALLCDLEGDDQNILADIVRTNPISTRGYTVWISRLLGKMYSSTGVCPKTPNSDAEQLTTEDDPIKRILEQVVQLIADEDLAVVNYAEDALRHIRTHEEASLNTWIVNSMEPSLYKSMGYLYTPREYSTTLIKFSKITDSSENTAYWIYQFCMALLDHITLEHSELRSLGPLLLNIPKFGKRILPSLVHLYLKALSSRSSNPELDEMLNLCLRESRNFEVQKLIISTFFYLRANKLTRDRLGRNFIDLDIKAGVKSCLQNNEPETALMLAELDWSNAELYNQQFTSFNLMPKIYEAANDPDMYYAIPTNPSLNGAIKTYLYENNNTRLLQYQSAFLNEKMILNEMPNDLLLPETLQNTGMLGISKLVLDSMTSEDEAKLYAQAWKLQQWDLAYSIEPKTRDEIVFNLHKTLNGTGDANEGFFEAYNTALSLLKVATRGNEENLFETLSIIRESEEIMSVDDNASALKISEDQMKIGRQWMDISR